MDIMNIQALIAQGLITDVASVDPNKAYVAVGIFQPGNRPAGSANANSYPSYAMPISEFLAAGGIYTGSNGIALVGNDFQLASLLVSQFTNDANYIAGTGTIGYVPRWDLTDTLGNSVIFDDGLGKVGIGTSSPLTKLQVVGGAGQAIYSTSTNDIAVNGVGTGATSYGIKGETDLGTAIFAKITNGSGTSGIAFRAHDTSGNTMFTVNGNSKTGVNTTNPLSALYVESLVQNEAITLNNDDITGSSYFGLAQSGGIKAGMILLNSNHAFIPKTLIVRNLWDAGSLRINGGSADTNMMLFDTTTFHVGINIQNPSARLDIIGDATNALFKLNNSNFLFADKLKVDNNGGFYSGSINAFGGFGSADFTTDHLNYKFNTSYQTYLAFTNAGGSGNRGGYGIIGSTIASADADYRLVVLNNDAGTLGSVLKVVSTATNNANDGFDYTNYGVNVASNGVFTNTGAGTFYKVGINLDITNGDVNRAINVENGVIRVVKANQPLYATLTSGDLYYDTAANILTNGDFVVGMKA